VITKKGVTTFLGLSLPVPSTTSWRAEIDGKEILRDDRDRWNFQGYLAEGAERYGVKVYCYVLMENHFIWW
jgi:hypothetical protein